MHPQQLRVPEDELEVPVSDATTARQVIELCLRRLGLTGPDDYTLSEVLIDRNGEDADSAAPQLCGESWSGEDVPLPLAQLQ